MLGSGVRHDSRGSGGFVDGRALDARPSGGPVVIASGRRLAVVCVMFALVGLMLGGPAASASPAPTAGSSRPIALGTQNPPTAPLTVMSRNLYLGADVGGALDLLPDMPAAAQMMWDQVATTDFDARVWLLAAEAASARPDVIGLQEATVWACRPGPLSSAVPVFDFTEALLAATRTAGVPYVIAERGDARAYNPGYAIPAIPWLTEVHDPATFQPLFGSDTANCGFTIADALLVRADLADSVLAVGTGEYEDRYPVVPVAFTIDRGFAWADLSLDGGPVRVVTTHLESLWDEGKRTPSAVQAAQLVDDLAATTAPLIVMGDLNADPRDPRPTGAANPAEQPVASDVCPAQPTPAPGVMGDSACNAYWTLRAAGYADAGPDVLDPANLTWGGASNLAGPDPGRVDDALAQGNRTGFTDRLDHILVRNGARAGQAHIIGNAWPAGSDLWACSAPDQVATTGASSTLLAEADVIDAPIVGRGVCLPTDHAGVVATVEVPIVAGSWAGDPPPEHSSLRIDLLGWIVIALGILLFIVTLIIWAVVHVVRRRRRRRRASATTVQP